MIFEQNKSIEKLGIVLGYTFSYLLFTTILFLILTLVKKIPESWTYFNIMSITIVVALTGIILKRFLK
jgi:hypothetical protein|tara:strand:+ start:169 stop:372 length:204 start_codon:yes stop_codon:yes gene_type:complete